MGINKVANQDDVRYRSGIYGWDGLLIRSLKEYVTKSSTGGGSVDITNYSTNINPGTTAGDTAKLSGWFGFSMNTNPSKITVEIGYYLNKTSNLTDDIQIGWMPENIDSNDGMYYNITDGQYIVNGTTASAPTPTGTNGASLLRIEADNDNVKTTFTQKGHVDDETTINAVPGQRTDLGRGLVLSKSNGAGDDIRVTYARQEVVF